LTLLSYVCLVKLVKSANRDIINNCLLHFIFSLPSELIHERKEKFVIKFASCHNLFWHFGIDFV